MKVLGLDFETTGTDPQTDRVIEVGYVQWDSLRKTPIQLGDFLINHGADRGVNLSSTIQEITGITPADISDHGTSPDKAFEPLVTAMSQVDYIVAHNGTRFDKPLFDAEIERLGWRHKVRALPWIDTMTDLPLDPKVISRRLDSLANLHGIAPHISHRAVFDVLTMLEVLGHYDFEAVIAQSKIPTILVEAVVTYENRELAKARGFFWNSESRRWMKWIKEDAISAEEKLGGFIIEKAT